MNKNVIIVLNGDDILVPKLIRQYIEKAKRLMLVTKLANNAYYENQIDYLEKQLKEISEKKDFPSNPKKDDSHKIKDIFMQSYIEVRLHDCPAWIPLVTPEMEEFATNLIPILVQFVKNYNK
jgi:hypothetical protein